MGWIIPTLITGLALGWAWVSCSKYQNYWGMGVMIEPMVAVIVSLTSWLVWAIL